MANKRFLGLGFTFAAQDKGLLKTLKSVQSTLSGITESLNEINGVGKTTSGTLGKIKMRGTAQTARAPKAQPIKKDIDRKKASFAELSKGNVFSKEDSAFFKEIKNSLNDKAFKMFVKDFDSLNKQFDDAGKLTDKFKEEVSKYAVAAFEANDGTAKLQKSLKGLFKSFGAYSKEVLSKTKAFMETLGVDLASIIPPQLTALGGVITSLVSPIINLGKNLTKSLFPSKAEKLQKKLLSQIGGSGRGNGTIYDRLGELLSAMAGGDDKKDDGGFFGKVKDIFSGLGSGLLGLMGLKKLFPILDKLKAVPSLLGKAGSGIFKVASKLGPKALGPLAGIVTTITSLVSGDSIVKAGSKGIGTTLGSVIGGTLGSALGPVGTIIGTTLGGVAGDFLGEKVGDFFDNGGGKELAKLPDKLSAAFNDFFSYFRAMFSEIPNIAKNLVSDFSTQASKGIKGIKNFFGFDDSPKENSVVSQKEYAPPVDKKFLISSEDDLYGEKQVNLTAQLVAETKRTNDLQMQMIDIIGKRDSMNGPTRGTSGGRSFKSDPQNQFLSEGAF